VKLVDMIMKSAPIPEVGAATAVEAVKDWLREYKLQAPLHEQEAIRKLIDRIDS
jgi:hypothetical protein